VPQALGKSSPEVASALSGRPDDSPLRWRPIWVADTGSSPDGFVTAVGCSPGADLIAVGDRSGCLRLYRSDGELITERRTGRTAGLTALAGGHHAGRPYLVSLDRGNVLQLWDGLTGEPLTSVALTGRRGSHLSLVSIGGRLIASLAGDEWRGVLIDLASGRKVARDEFEPNPAVFLDGHPVTVTADADGVLQVTPIPVATTTIPAARRNTAPSAAGLGEDAPRGLDPASGPAAGAAGPVLCFDAGGRLMAGVVRAQQVTIWDVAEHRAVDVLTAPVPVDGLAATDGGDLMLLAGGEAVYLAHEQPATGTQPETTP
jgi:hypothetical protein